MSNRYRNFSLQNVGELAAEQLMSNQVSGMSLSSLPQHLIATAFEGLSPPTLSLLRVRLVLIYKQIGTRLELGLEPSILECINRNYGHD